MSHVICDPHASSTIKSYSPNLMVHPYMQSTPPVALPSSPATPAPNTESLVNLALTRILPLLPRLHVLVIGPGLGRDPIMQATVAQLITAARARDMGLVLDADALMVVQANPDLIRGYSGAILTPNHAEFGRLCAALGIGEKDGGGEDKDKGELCALVARNLGGVTVLQKGPQDWISNGATTLRCSVRGGLKRSGGQGDTLTGCIGTMLAWKRMYLEGLWEYVHPPPKRKFWWLLT